MSHTNGLPDNLDACHALILQQQAVLQQQQVVSQQLQTLVEQQGETNETLARKLESVTFELEQLKRHLFGRRSERHVDNPAQLELFEDLPPQTNEPVAEEPLEEEITYRRRKARSKADRFPESLPRQIQVIDVPESERTCSCCGEEMPVIDMDIRERLEYVPAKLIVHELQYPKRACSKCKSTVAMAAPPEPAEAGAALTPGSRYGFGVTAQIILGKYADHLPLYRLEDVFARAGVVIPRSTQVGLLDAAADLAQPLLAHMTRRVLEPGALGLDDTPVRLQDESLPGKMRTARIWLARGREEAPYNVFFFHDSRNRDGPAQFLGDYQGWVTVDAYGVNDGVYLGSGGRILASCCNAHARRKFEAALGNDPKRASQALAIYRQLYDIEDRGRELSAQERLELRQSESAPLMDRLKSWLDGQAAERSVLPKSAIGAAVRYALNQWKPLSAFLSGGRLPIDNNDTERDLRRIAIGRKNWLFIGSKAAGEVAATMTTLVASASRHSLDIWAYLDDVLRRLAAGDDDLDGMLPDRWRAAHPESVRTYRDAEREARRARTQKLRVLRRKKSGKRS